MIGKWFKKTPVVPESRIDRLTYAIGDVHGMIDPFRNLLNVIRHDALSIGERPRIVLLGDYIDRGPSSSEVLDEILRLEADIQVGRGWCDLEVLRGNHEQAMIAFLETGEGSVWLKYGGNDCLLSYGVDIPKGVDPRQVSDLLRLSFAQKFPPAHRNLIARMKDTFRAGDYLFVHAGVSPSKPLNEQGPDTFLWIRNEFLSAPRACDFVVVHGHTPMLEPTNTRWRIGVDTGAYETGVLTAVRLFEDKRQFIQAS